MLEVKKLKAMHIDEARPHLERLLYRPKKFEKNSGRFEGIERVRLVGLRESDAIM